MVCCQITTYLRITRQVWTYGLICFTYYKIMNRIYNIIIDNSTFIEEDNKTMVKANPSNEWGMGELSGAIRQRCEDPMWDFEA